MWNPKLLLVLSLCISALSACTAASGGKPLVTAVTKDASTSLYTAPLKAGHPLLVDLSGAAISLTTCTSKTGTVATLTANATNGQNPLFPVSFSAVVTCAQRSGLPSGAVGVAGLGPSTQSLTAQVARTQRVANELALCLPSDGKSTSGNSVGVAIFGGGPFIFPDRGDFTQNLAGTAPLVGFNGGSPGYYISASAITVEHTQIGKSGPFIIQLSSTTPYTALRSDVYAPFVKAFDQDATGPNFPWMTRVASVAPFERCYDSTKLPPTRLGYAVPEIDLVLSGGTFFITGGNSMVQVNSNTACLGFVKNKASGAQVPAVILGGFQLENRLLVLDNAKHQLGFSTFLNAIGLSCSSFNFTLGA